MKSTKRVLNKNIIILLIVGIISILSVFITGHIFGANMDWINQHTVIPNLFREYFYNTGKLIPNIFYNIGLGENAFNFSYYGLLSPIILVSYFLPIINMTTYIMISSIILYLLSIFLFYKWINQHYNSKYSFLLTLIFMMSQVLLFQFHRQIMFVNYFPFLLLALINIDGYDKKINKVFLPINIFLIIMSSYYFSIGSIIVLIIYYIYINYNKKILDKVKILLPILISILCSSIILIPTFLSLLNGRADTSNVNLFSLFIPDFSYDNILYGGYSLGLYAISIVSLVALLIKKYNKNKFLSITLLLLITLPFFRYILNGGLYIRSKALIPFLPLFILIIGIFIHDLFTDNIDYKKLLIVLIPFIVLGLFNFSVAYYLDLFLTIIIILLYSKFNKKFIIYVPIIVVSLIGYIYINITEKYISYDEYNKLSENINIDADNYRVANLKNTLYNVNRSNYLTNSIYSSTVNPAYKNFYYHVMGMNNNNYNNLIIRATDNIILNKLLGVKYVVSDKELQNGYELIDKDIYENKYVLPIGYASSNLYSVEEFNKLEYPFNIKYLLNGIVVDSSTNKINFNLNELEFIKPNDLGSFISIFDNNDYKEIKVSEESAFTVDLPHELNNQLLIIQIDGLESNSCSNDDIGITINGVENTLSCDKWIYNNKNNQFNYLINENNLSTLNVIMKKGTYRISSIKMYTLDISELESDFDEMNNIIIKNNILTGDISIREDGYMTLSIPYDKGFKVYVDDNKVDIEKVNTAFIGFKITAGNHKIKVIYNSPGLKTGKLISIIGLLIFVIYLIKIFINKK